MNRKDRRSADSKKNEPVIPLRGKAYTIAEATNLAIAEYRQGNLEAAAYIFQSIALKLPGDINTHNNLGNILQEMTRYNEALACYDKAIALKPDNATAYFNRAILFQHMNKPEEALSSLDHAINHNPAYADAYTNRGVILQEMTRYHDALASYDKAIAINADDANAYNNRGNSLHALKRYDEALASYAKAIALRPDNPSAYNNRGTTLQELKQYDEAQAHYHKAIALNPNYTNAYYNLGTIAQALKRYPEALTYFDKAITLNPDYADAYNNRGATLQEMKRYDEALTCYDKAISLHPNFSEAHNNRGATLQEMKRYDDALASFEQAIILNPANAEAYNNRGNVYEELKRYDEALKDYDHAIAIKPDYASAYNNRGTIMVSNGNMEEAEAMYLKAFAIKPDFPNPLYSLTRIRQYKDTEHDDIKAIQTLLANPAVTPDDKEFLYFALGKIYDDCGLYDQAFDYYRQANQIVNSTISYNANGLSKTINDIIEIFSADFIKEHHAFSRSNESPIFIVGMPRSGTTLMASILSNHPSIASAGELPDITKLTTTLPDWTHQPVPYPQGILQITPEIVKLMTDHYIKRLRRDTATDMPYIIDKHPLNFWHLGFITLLFPKAKIIHCTRNPLDTMLSNYFQRFSSAYEYSFDLQNIAHFYKEYRKIMEHWQKVLPGNMIEISYEDAIMYTEDISRKALNFLALPWDERCLSPHTNTTAIETASQWQVRQPIYQGSMERWRHYEKYLGKLLELL